MIFFQHCFPLIFIDVKFSPPRSICLIKKNTFLSKVREKENAPFRGKRPRTFSTCPKEKMPKISLSLPSLEMNVYLGSSWWWWYYRNSNLLMDNLANKNIVYNFLTLWLPFKNLHSKFQIWWWKPLKWGFKFSF